MSILEAIKALAQSTQSCVSILGLLQKELNNQAQLSLSIYQQLNQQLTAQNGKKDNEAPSEETIQTASEAIGEDLETKKPTGKGKKTDTPQDSVGPTDH